jgi:hypothetical protein
MRRCIERCVYSDPDEHIVAALPVSPKTDRVGRQQESFGFSGENESVTLSSS